MTDPQISKQKRVGGLAFFCSLICLSLLAALSTALLPMLWRADSSDRILNFSLGIIPGVSIALYVFSGKYNVLIHEFKHWIVSNLAGNKYKGLKIGEDSGHFSYGYYKHTAAYNAFISVAPYCLPLFTFLAFLIAYAGWRHTPSTMAIIIGVGYGCDLVMNTRDISPRQTDLSNLRGGYYVGLAYVLAANICTTSFLLAWLMQGLVGLKLMLLELWKIGRYLVDLKSDFF